MNGRREMFAHTRRHHTVINEPKIVMARLRMANFRKFECTECYESLRRWLSWPISSGFSALELSTPTIWAYVGTDISLLSVRPQLERGLSVSAALHYLQYRTRDQQRFLTHSVLHMFAFIVCCVFTTCCCWFFSWLDPKTPMFRICNANRIWIAFDIADCFDAIKIIWYLWNMDHNEIAGVFFASVGHLEWNIYAIVVVAFGYEVINRFQKTGQRKPSW